MARKWRPSLALVVALVCAGLISVPLMALLALRLTSNQFVRETEQGLINQAAIYAQVYAAAFTGPPMGQALDDKARDFWGSNLHPVRPRLDLRRSAILPPLPETPVIRVLSPPHQAVASALLTLAGDARRTTLAGVIFLDHRGQDLHPDRAHSYAAEPEVQAALRGKVGTALRDRGDAYNRHALTSISRDTWYRVFVAYPVIVENRVIGAVYLSRTPSNLGKFIATERFALLAMLLATVLTATLIGFLLLRLFLHPVRALSRQSDAIASGQLAEPHALAHYGVKELAHLGENVMRMAQTLTRRSREIATYTDHVTHELKSPTTAIIGAAELLQGDLPEDTRAHLHHTLLDQGHRMDALLEQLRDITRLKDTGPLGPARLTTMLPDIPGLTITADDPLLPLSQEHGAIVIGHLARNAREHGADALHIDFIGRCLTLRDNGTGIAPENAQKVLEPFFTTRRDEGGTGMGLAIVQAVLENYGATLSALPATDGAAFQIRFTD